MRMSAAEAKSRKEPAGERISMSIGARIRKIREKKGLSQGDIERTTGLLRCYTSRVENGHTVPSLETLERFAAALDLPLHELFYADENAPTASNPNARKSLEEIAEDEGKDGTDARFLLKMKSLLGHLADPDRTMLLTMARKLAAR